MPITLTKLRSRIAHRLGGAVSSKLDQDDLVNEAGRLLVTMHPWKFLEMPPVSLNFTASQEYIALPSDFGEMVAIEAHASEVLGFTLTTFDHMARLRAEDAVEDSVTYFGCVVRPGQTSTTSAPPVPRLELYPTPTANLSNALKLWYRRTWTEITYSSGNEAPNIPTYCDSLLTELCAALAQGYEESDNASLSDRITQIQVGPLFQNAVRYDGSTQSDYGWIGPGAAGYVPRERVGFYSGLVQAPS